ncbi:MAG TPA: ATP-binding protein [Candidatus Paceibacterota bacterium]|nr:ATP-binding protein [Candidatus Paceibacterota bacterium]
MSVRSQRVPLFLFLKNELRPRRLFIHSVVFALCFGTAKLAQYLLYTEQTSPAVLWPPFGIALGAILVWGYRMWLPIALAALLSSYSSTVSLPILLAATIGQTIQPLVAAYAMHRFHFENSISRLSSAFTLIAAALTSTIIAPALYAGALVSMHAIPPDFGTRLLHIWAGGILSVFILTPLITTWATFQRRSLTKIESIELACSFVALAATTFFLFWTSIAASFSVIGIYVLIGILVWIALDLEFPFTTAGLALVTVLGMAGTIIANPTHASIAQQLYSDELFIELIALIFILFAAIVEERRRNQRHLEMNIGELQRALQRIATEDNAKNQFIATLAHELRNPLAPVVSALDLLSLQNPSDEALHTIVGAQRELAVMRRLLDDILDVARVSQNRFRLQTEITDARPILERCVESVRVFFQNRRHVFSVSIPRDAMIVEIDPIRFQQIVVNLLNNAGKYTPAGGRIELSCAKEGSQAVIRIRDNGVGIPRESMTEIFEPFRQIRPTPQQLGTGLGIGLWLTKRLIDLHGGTITAESEGLERGSCFSIYLPLREQPHMSTNQKYEDPSQIPAAKILIVDDNEAAALAMHKLLTLKGHHAHAVHSGAMALKAEKEFCPEVVLLDIGLPDTDGYSVAQELRMRGSRAFLIALTGYGQEEDKSRAYAAGFDQHLTKPVGIADLEAVLLKRLTTR